MYKYLRQGREQQLLLLYLLPLPMKLDNLVTTYEQSKRIKGLGFEKKSYFLREKEYDEGQRVVWPEILFWGYEKAAQYYHCFVAEELGEILPEDIEVFKDGKLYQYRLRTQKSAERREVYYYDDIRQEYLLDYVPARSDKKEGFILWPTLAQAMGDMLIYLLENNLLPTNETDDVSPNALSSMMICTVRSMGCTWKDNAKQDERRDRRDRKDNAKQEAGRDRKVMGRAAKELWASSTRYGGRIWEKKEKVVRSKNWESSRGAFGRFIDR